MNVTFLGTSSGGGPTPNRNCSSLVCDFFEGSNLWMVDCAEGTTRQFALQPQRHSLPRIRINQINRLFVTHMHADHIMGIPTLLRNILRAPSINDPPNVSERMKVPSIHIYGPCGLRSFIRQNLKMTFTRTSDAYVVHELLRTNDSITPCNPPSDERDPNPGSSYRDWDVLHSSEIPGRDILADDQGLWRDIGSQVYSPCSRRTTRFSIHAGPILHREPCIGYVFDEITSPRHKIVVLGDTYDPSPLIPLCEDPSPTLLIHEATDSTISPERDRNGKLSKRTIEVIMKTTLARGHSTPVMAGEFARRVDAQALVLNHIGSRFPAPSVTDKRGYTHMLLEDMAEQATRAWGPTTGERAIVALDFMRIFVPEPGQIISQPGDMEFSPQAFSAAPTFSLPPSLPRKPFTPQNAFTPTIQLIGASNLAQNNDMQPTIPWTNQNNVYTVDHGFHSSAPPCGALGPSIPVQTIGQLGCYGLPADFDSIQQTQSLYAFEQMQTIQQMNMPGASVTEGMATGMRREMGAWTQMPVSARMGPGSSANAPVRGGYPSLVRTIEAPRHQPRLGITGNLEGLERDPVIARSIVAAHVKYDDCTSAESRGNNEKRKFEG